MLACFYKTITINPSKGMSKKIDREAVTHEDDLTGVGQDYLKCTNGKSPMLLCCEITQGESIVCMLNQIPCTSLVFASEIYVSKIFFHKAPICRDQHLQPLQTSC